MTEQEDLVYCLLGLLGVSMPATYGEGLESVLERLRAEIQGAGNAPSIIPFSGNPHFVGRESQPTGSTSERADGESTNTYSILYGDVHFPERPHEAGEPSLQQCLRDLRVTDPREDGQR